MNGVLAGRGPEESLVTARSHVSRLTSSARPNGDPSADINQFRDDVEAFLNARHPLGSENTGPAPSSPLASAKLVKSTTWNKSPDSVYNVRWATSSDNTNTVPAYYLRYQSISIQGNQVPFVDIPARREADFLFTGELAGCSLVVVRRGDGLRVYHDSRYCSSVLYDNVVMAVDYCDYREAYEDPVLRKFDPATVFMHCQNGTWKLYAQFLQENEQHSGEVARGDVPECKRVLRYRDRDHFVVKTQYVAPDIEADREVLYQELKKIAIEYLGAANVPTTQDAEFADFAPNQPPSLSNPAVARTEALRQAMVQHGLENIFKQKVAEKKEEAAQQKGRPVDPTLDLHRVHQRLELAFRVFLKRLSDSKSTDATYLWLKLKQAQNLQAVVAE
ncbi:hypothetical protein P170DRAFT_513368 [Aspergillus steynii IBT 23096]|uniref:Uncharacterized protein n=1 Tax=Aspergillus steynii IBT 23096 TaxID=1392250 RepID=A0A2I2FU22_9EURO|nr:uncharacterized protein P170DRAFT_513368 [Aspergillus steynii IBT 23096]PLB44101.1 hypothetical protein P170DRAFT_513368 [Aspergillus steynii IBT 23096]